MRPILLAAALAAFTIGGAQAAELTVLAPGFVANAGIKDLAASYEKETGVKVTVKSTGMGAMMDTIKTGTPAADIVMLPRNLMDQLSADKGIVVGSRKPLGRVQIGLIVQAGAPHPDISTVAKLAAALKSAKQVAYSSPFRAEKSMQAMIIHTMLQKPEFAGVHADIVEKGNAVNGIKQGADMGLQLVCETRDPAVSLVGDLPQSLHAWLDGDVAVSSRAADPKAAAAFVAYSLKPAASPVWKAKGLDRY
ncbi:MAG TPA: substrate-binding domain-containing protein [Rhizomicrobium sp.]|jgi:molybdate transport system substrate-binding protein|nr:substrate-binding domain-containing protein [Rhizomicrobium sp.]